MSQSIVEEEPNGLDWHLNKLPLNQVPQRHREVVVQAVSNVLATEAAESTFAQIVDGLPLSHVEKDGYDGSLSHQHPLHTQHTELCPGALETVQQLRQDFDGSNLSFYPKLIHEYQTAAVGSRAFRTRLVEMVAVAVHQIAVQLFQLKISKNSHSEDELSCWKAPKEDRRWWALFPSGTAPTLFRHSWYCDYDQYPDRVADGVAYWAESRILGGVVLFDRRQFESAPDVEPDAIYFHPCRRNVTYRIYILLDSQKQDLIQFLLAEETPQTPCPLPILGDKDNYKRVDPEEPIETTGIYRDKCERKPLSPDAPDRRVKDVWDQFNWPTWEDWDESSARGYDRKDFLTYGELI
ncbi:Fc.00g012080.m01.CDS01 [Cosmosporella sp. VM-42]